MFDEPTLFAGTDSYNRAIYEDDLLRVGLFRTRPWEDLFHSDNQALGRYLVFPHTGVLITPEGSEEVVADPTIVMLYNKYQQYRRAPLSEHGDACVYFEFAPQVLYDVLPYYEPDREDRPDYPFPINYSPSDPQAYLLHGLVVRHILNHEHPDSLFVQETMLQVLARIVHNAFPQHREGKRHSAAKKTHVMLARETQALLATRFYESLTLQEIAAHLYVSPYHLCRVFRRHKGVTIHQYRNDLRLRVALERVLGGESDLSSLALTLGYASHSHFTQSFRSLFATTPSELRDARLITDLQHIRQMSKILTA